MKKKILHFTKGGGGLDIYISQILKYHDKEAFSHVVVCSHDYGDLHRVCKSLDLTFYHVPIVREISPYRDFITAFQFCKILKKERPDIVHVHSSKAGALGRPIVSLFSSSCLYTPHALNYQGESGIKKWVYWGIEWLLGRFTDAFVPNSQSEANRIQTELGISPDRIHTFTNCLEISELGVDLALPPLTNEKRSKTILMVGRINRQKNPFMFTRCCHLLRDRFPEFIYKIIGAGVDDFLGRQLKFLVEESGLANAFKIIEWMPRKRVLEEMAQAMVVCVPSKFESFGYVAAEAGLVGTPVVVADSDGLRDIVIDGKTGFIVSQDDFQAMADRVSILLSNPSKYNTMAVDARRHVANTFDVRTHIRCLEQIYQDLPYAA